MSGSYNYFNNLYKAESGLDFTNVTQAMQKAGNTPGIYPDVALLLHRCFVTPEVETFFELGSGASTCVLANAAQRLNKEYHAVEHLKNWYDVTCDTLRRLNLPSTGLVCSYSKEENFPQPGNIDVIWVDGTLAETVDSPYKGRLQSCLYYQEQLAQAVYLVDDAQFLVDYMKDWMPKLGRSYEDMEWFNPTGRGDRQVCISYPTKDHPLREVVNNIKWEK